MALAASTSIARVPLSYCGKNLWGLILINGFVAWRPKKVSAARNRNHPKPKNETTKPAPGAQLGQSGTRHLATWTKLRCVHCHSRAAWPPRTRMTRGVNFVVSHSLSQYRVQGFRVSGFRV